MVWCGVGALGGSGVATEGLTRNISQIIINRSVLMSIIRDTLFQSERIFMESTWKYVWEYIVFTLQGLVIFSVFVIAAIAVAFIAKLVAFLGMGLAVIAPIQIVAVFITVYGVYTTVMFFLHKGKKPKQHSDPQEPSNQERNDK